MTLVKNRNAMILGAGSGVGRALATYLASLNYNLLLCARNERDVTSVSMDLEYKYNATIKSIILDTNRENTMNDFFKEVDINSFDEIYITIGKVSEVDNGEQCDAIIDDLVNSNFVSLVKFINRIISNYQDINRLKMLVVSSIATSRARKNNMVYSSAKMGFDFYCQALQHKLNATNISICICRLGYTDTEMSYGQKTLFHASDTHKAALELYIALKNNRRLFYLPRYWKYIHLLINLIPWTIYRRITF